jgi:hypothetical protein
MRDNGQVLLAGGFHSYNGSGRNRIVRINNGLDPLVTVRPRIFLDGPLNTTTNIMGDQLRSFHMDGVVMSASTTTAPSSRPSLLR